MNPWVLAARPATLPAGVAAVVVGSALAAADGVFRWDALVVTLFAAVAIQIGVNFANDLADAQKGADTAARIGPTRAVAAGLLTPGQMKRGIAVAFGLAAIAGCYLIWLAGWVILANVIAWPIAWFAMRMWLQNFAYRVGMSWWLFLLAGIVALVIALLTVSFQAIKTAVANPIKTLRYE